MANPAADPDESPQSNPVPPAPYSVYVLTTGTSSLIRLGRTTLAPVGSERDGHLARLPRRDGRGDMIRVA
jgi:hypothetical protein